MELFDTLAREQTQQDAPLADYMRARTLDEFVGQAHLVGKGQPLYLLMENQQPISMILWGPPGVGKTTLAMIFAAACDAEIFALSAVASGVSDVRRVIEKAQVNKKVGRRSVLFIDEIHRFNKAQQDALLHSVEDGTIFLIGATTENPSFEVISPLLSRCRVYTLHLHNEAELDQLLHRALLAFVAKTGVRVELDADARQLLIQFANGDGRELINGLELSAYLTKPDTAGIRKISAEQIGLAFQRKVPQYDKGGDAHYDTISAFIKSVRGSDPNAALHYLARMLDAGEDPRFIARRLIILASEDVGNAEPSGLVLANAAFNAVHVIGLPEAQLVLAQVTTFLAAAPKSNASYLALKQAQDDVRNQQTGPIPMHLRNAPTELMSQEGYGKDYRYPHDYPGAFVFQEYLPENLRGRIYYRPNASGREVELANRLRALWPAYAELPTTREQGKTEQ